MKLPKRPKDANLLARQIVEIATKQRKDPEGEKLKNPAAVALGKLGGAKGGPARAKKLSAKRRKEIAKKAAQKRWAKAQDQKIPTGYKS